MKHFSWLLVALLAFGLSSCSPISVRSEYDEEVAFENYRTFKWMPRAKKGKKSVRRDSKLDRRIRAAVERELKAKGLEVRESGETDAVLAYHVAAQKNVRMGGYGYGYGYGYRHYHGYHGPRVYRVGTIIIDIVDPKLEQLIWRGAAKGAVGHPDGSLEKVNAAMTKVFEEYPPQ